MVALTPHTASGDLMQDQAGATIRELVDVGDLTDAARLLDEVWGMTDGASVVPVGLLRAWAFTGNYVTAAYLDGQLVGVSAGFLGRDHGLDGPVLHSHVTGVSARARGRQVGLALKLHQRAWAAERGIERITWTFDPVIRRNAHFNLHKLGADPVAYLDDFYGTLTDDLNAGQSTDRLLVSWEVRGPCLSVVRRPGRQARWLLADVDGRPQPHADAGLATQMLVALPADIEGLRRTDPALATAWRAAVRDALRTDGARLVGLTPDGCYLLERDG